MYKRLDEEELEKLDYEYSHNYWLYNPISSAVEEHESCKGGLRGAEVWKEVLELEKRLPQHERMDRWISKEYTNLLNKMDGFCESRDGYKGYVILKKNRSGCEKERSAWCILLAILQRLGQYWDHMVNPYQPIINRVWRIANECENKDMLLELIDAFYIEEDEEEKYKGETAPEEDVLAPYRQIHLVPEIKEIRDRMIPILSYFATTLELEAGISTDFDAQSFALIWNDLSFNEDILQQLEVFSSSMKNTIPNHDPEASDEVKEGRYNLKMILNIIGVMIKKGVIKTNIRQTCQLFFDDTKDEHFKESRYSNFSNGSSGLKDEKMLQFVEATIEKHRKIK